MNQEDFKWRQLLALSFEACKHAGIIVCQEMDSWKMLWSSVRDVSKALITDICLGAGVDAGVFLIRNSPFIRQLLDTLASHARSIPLPATMVSSLQLHTLAPT